MGEHKPRYALAFRFADSKRNVVLGLLVLTLVTGAGIVYSLSSGNLGGATFFGVVTLLDMLMIVGFLALPYSRFSRAATHRRRIGDDVVAIGTVIIAVLTLIAVLGIIGDAANHLWTWLTHLHVRP